MELWLDTINEESIEHAKELGLLHGVTTNPSILGKASAPAEEVLERILSRFSGPLAVQVTQKTALGMIEQGKELLEFSSRIIVKIPVTEEGIQAINRLSHLEIPTMATAIFNPMQAFHAAKAGARYVVPYYAHIGAQMGGGDAHQVCESIQTILKENRSTAKLLVAALRNVSQLERCAKSGFSAVTLKESLFKESLEAPEETLEHLERFEADWKAGPSSELLSAREKVRKVS